jgi:hypothetical protein
MAYAGSHVVAYFEFVQLALWLETLSRCDGFASVRKALRRDPRDDVMPHLRLQLEVGALAESVGWRVRFERPIDGSTKVSDITIGAPGGDAMIVEARVLLPDQGSVEINTFTDTAFRRVQQLSREYGIDCAGDIEEILDEPQLDELLGSIEDHARLVRIGATPPPLRLHGARLQVSRAGSTPDRALRGPALRGDLWPRIAERLQKKARQTEGGRNVWLRLCALQGLWLFTSWGTMTLAEKLATMSENLAVALSGHPHVDGVVLSSALAWPQGEVTPGEHYDDDGGYALRCAVPPILARETLIVALRGNAQPSEHARSWRDIYIREPDWAEHSLDRFGLPSVKEIFAPGDTSVASTPAGPS